MAVLLGRMVGRMSRECTDALAAVVTLFRSTCKDRESAYVSMNDKKCAIKENLVGTNGKQLCGGWYKEEVFRVKGCRITLTAAPGVEVPLTVQIWADLDGDAEDESFGIDNVVVARFTEEGYRGVIYDSE